MTVPPPTALLTFSLGPVHAFISQARRVADVWAGSDLLSHLMGRAVGAARKHGGEPVFPLVEDGEAAAGIPNRVVCRIPVDVADRAAQDMEAAVQDEWRRLAGQAVETLRQYGIDPDPSLWPAEGENGPRQTDHVFQAAWSWVPEDGGYATAAAQGADRYAASRLYRPFPQVEQQGEKCALCGERTALPDGDRNTVRTAWKRAEETTQGTQDERFFRFDQGRLCLVCATKRLYTRNLEGKRAYFRAFDAFDEEAQGQGEEKEKAPYVALVNLDGDRMSQALAWGEDEIEGEIQDFHQALSRALNEFARSLRTPRTGDALPDSQLNLRTLGIESRAGKRANRPQLIYAGGDDVLVVCSPADALPVARAIQRQYASTLRSPLEKFLDSDRLQKLTLSGAILFAHGRYPAGAMFRDVERLLKDKAKGEAGRNALAIRLDKRGGVPVEVAFKWSQREDPNGTTSWPDALDDLVNRIRAGTLGSTLTFNLRREEKVLLPVLETKPDRWVPWLQDRLGRSGVSRQYAEELAPKIAPFFEHRKTRALRIARFLGREVDRETPAASEASP